MLFFIPFSSPCWVMRLTSISFFPPLLYFCFNTCCIPSLSVSLYIYLCVSLSLSLFPSHRPLTAAGRCQYCLANRPHFSPSRQSPASPRSAAGLHSSSALHRPVTQLRYLSLFLVPSFLCTLYSCLYVCFLVLITCFFPAVSFSLLFISHALFPFPGFPMVLFPLCLLLLSARRYVDSR